MCSLICNSNNKMTRQYHNSFFTGRYGATDIISMYLFMDTMISLVFWTSQPTALALHALYAQGKEIFDEVAL